MLTYPIPCRHYRTGEVFLLDASEQGVCLRRPASEVETDLYIAPALFDAQVNGYRGINLTSKELTVEQVAAVVEYMRERGVPFFCPTVIGMTPDVIRHALRTIAQACESSAELARAMPGIHLEGPYISSETGPRGAFQPSWTWDPTWEEFSAFQEAAGGRITLLTMAPEREGALPFIEKAAAHGVCVALGHTGASSEVIAAAVTAGARAATHLGNGAHAMLPRHPNYLWDQLAADAVTATIIADGFHLPPAVVKTFIRAKEIGRTVLISDVASHGGMPPGRYQFVEYDIEVMANGKIALAGTPFLAGAGLTLDVCTANAANFAGIDIADAIDMASLNPARLLGCELTTLSPDGGDVSGVMLYRWDGERLEIVQTVR